MRVLPVLSLIGPVLLSACDGEGAAGPALPAPEARAEFPPGGVANAIALTTIDRLPLRAAELVAPDGKETPAGPITATPSPSVAGGQWLANDPYRHDLTAATGNFGSSAQLPPGVVTSLQGHVQLLATVSQGSIAVPDEAAYRRDWAKYRVRLHFGDPPGAVTREIAAPAPPASG